MAATSLSDGEVGQARTVSSVSVVILLSLCCEKVRVPPCDMAAIAAAVNAMMLKMTLAFILISPVLFTVDTDRISKKSLAGMNAYVRIAIAPILFLNNVIFGSVE